ncbi:hypothetical protein SGLAM104S_10258 [Streptomyces glaucescens]
MTDGTPLTGPATPVTGEDAPQAVPDGSLPGPDGAPRCPWALSAPDYLAYHDDEWGRPVHGDDALFERLCLEAFQSGLSWITILRRRPGFRTAFAGFRIAEVAGFTDADRERLLADPGIIRNRAKIDATLANARVLADWAPGELDELIWSHAPDPAVPPGPEGPRRRPGDHPGVDGPVQGAEEARPALRRPHDGVRADAGVRPGRRSPGDLRRQERPPGARGTARPATPSPAARHGAPAPGAHRPRYLGFSLFTNARTAIAWSSEAPARAWSSSSFSSASSKVWVSAYATDSFSAA